MALKDYAHCVEMNGTSLKTVQSWLRLLVGVLFLAIVGAWRMPVEANIDSYHVESADTFAMPSIPELQEERTLDTEHKPFEGRSGLFKMEAPVNNAPRSDKTVETVLSQLQLQMILAQNGKTVAYIIFKGKDLRVCSVGDTIEDTVQVTHIDVQAQYVEVLVGSQKETIRL